MREDSDMKLARELTFHTEDDAASISVYSPNDLKKFAFYYGRTFEKFSSTSFIPPDSALPDFFAKMILTGKIDMFVLRLKGYKNDIILRNNSTGKLVHLEPPQKTTTENEKGEQVIIRD